MPGEAGSLVRVLSNWLVFGFVPLFALAAISLVVRFRRSRGAERQQLKWIAATVPIIVALVGGTYLVGALIGAGPVSDDPENVGGPVLLLVAAGVLSPGLLPVAIGLAILRYRLYDIDVVIRRTLVYGALTAILAAAYVGTIALFQLGLSSFTARNQLAVAASTLLVAALFQPLRAAIQRAVDRRFYRRKYDAAKTLETFGARLRSQVDIESLRAEVVAAARETVQPRQASLWLRR